MPDGDIMISLRRRRRRARSYPGRGLRSGLPLYPKAQGGGRTRVTPTSRRLN